MTSPEHHAHHQHQGHTETAGGHHHHGRAYDRDMRNADWQEVWDRQRGREAMERGWLDALALAPGSHLLDVGSGPGFVSLLAAERVGPAGRVYAVDPSPAALAFLRERLAERAAANVEPLVGAGDVIPLPDASASHALLAQMLHHTDAPEAILREVLRVLAPGGAALIVEHDPAGSTESGPPAADRLPAARVQDWLAAAGYDGWQACEVGEDRYGLLARKPVG
ncbi:MAG TPA: methyltransferase domain-containing protein [Chloroflexota bacterium]|nr:methyltransferase domain-containing protein [Chloroflexota bacterium]